MPRGRPAKEFLFTSDGLELWKLFVTGPLLLASMKGAKDPTIWIGDTLELEFNARRDGIFEAALLQFAVMGTVDALSVKKRGDAFDNSGDEDARWHEVNWMELRPVCVLHSLSLSCWLFGVMCRLARTQARAGVMRNGNHSLPIPIRSQPNLRPTTITKTPATNPRRLPGRL